MSIKINSFGGPIVWIMRKHCSNITSRVMLKYAQRVYSKKSKEYIDWFFSQENAPLPLNVMIETINRCNGKCEFCPANSRDEKRELKRMSDELFHSIINQLRSLEWEGKLFMCVNNEPLLDKRIIDFSKYAKNQLPHIRIALITNGTLLDEKLLDSMSGIIDEITINDYSEKYRFTEKNKNLIRYIRMNSEVFGEMKIVFNRRYSKEILATRAGSAPNKPKKNINVNSVCLYPFTDLIIFPDGKVGMCCNDCFEVTNYGNIIDESIKHIWTNEKMSSLREIMRNGREHPFCKECDVVDAGEREKEINSILESK